MAATVAIILLLCLVASTDTGAASCPRRWCKLISMECMSDSSALVRWNAPSLQGCLMKASSSAVDDMVVQWSRLTGACSLFQYQQVCRMLQPGTNASAPCSVYRAGALASCDAALKPPLLGVWIAGGRSRFSNLVCQSDPANYRLHAVNVQWTEEGANFDGASSYALSNDSRFIDTSTSSGFTWLLRLKRMPRIQPFMEVIPCDTSSSVFGRHFWEYQSINQMFYTKNGFSTDANNFRIFSAQNVLSGNRDAWINVGISIGNDAASSAFFYNGVFFSASVATKTTAATLIPYCYLSVGHRFATTYYLNGVVQAVAVSNRSMTEQEIRDFFAILP